MMTPVASTQAEVVVDNVFGESNTLDYLIW